MGRILLASRIATTIIQRHRKCLKIVRSHQVEDGQRRACYSKQAPSFHLLQVRLTLGLVYAAQPKPNRL
jgi:hypothetical protein